MIKAKEREESRLIAAQEKLEHKRLDQPTKNVIGIGYGPGKGKSKTAMRKKSNAIKKEEIDQKKFKARMERLEAQKMNNLEDTPDMDDYKYRRDFK